MPHKYIKTIRESILPSDPLMSMHMQKRTVLQGYSSESLLLVRIQPRVWDDSEARYWQPDVERYQFFGARSEATPPGAEIQTRSATHSSSKTSPSIL